MKLYNIKENDEQVSFGQAVRQGLGRNQGLFSHRNYQNLKMLMRCWQKTLSLVARKSYQH